MREGRQNAKDEIIDFIVAGKSPEQIDAFRPSEGTLARVFHLIQLAKADPLSPEGRTEPEDFLQLDHLVIVAKARARPCAAWSRNEPAIAVNTASSTSMIGTPHITWIAL